MSVVSVDGGGDASGPDDRRDRRYRESTQFVSYAQEKFIGMTHTFCLPTSKDCVPRIPRTISTFSRRGRVLKKLEAELFSIGTKHHHVTKRG
jgi:hypothetical protein